MFASTSQDGPHRGLTDRAGQALRIIGAESEVNMIRARTWGLIQRLEKEEADAAEAQRQMAAGMQVDV